MRPPRSLLPCALAAALAAALPLHGCIKKNPTDILAPIAANAGATGRGPVATAVAAELTANSIQAGDAITHAQRLLEEAEANPQNAALSTQATEFAGGVLDALLALEAKLPTGDMHEFFWMTVGRLAFQAAEEAHAQDRLLDAQSLVFAGPKRWQTGSYWERYSDHDALAAVILAKSGNPQEAIRRLESRADLRDAALVVYQELTGRR